MDLAVRAEHGRRNWAKVGPKMHAKAQVPERPKKIAAARTGNPRPKLVVAALKRTHTNRQLTAIQRAKMSAVHKKRGTRPPWLTAPGPARKTRYSREAVARRRRQANRSHAHRDLYAAECVEAHEESSRYHHLQLDQMNRPMFTAIVRHQLIGHCDAIPCLSAR